MASIGGSAIQMETKTKKSQEEYLGPPQTTLWIPVCTADFFLARTENPQKDTKGSTGYKMKVRLTSSCYAKENRGCVEAPWIRLNKDSNIYAEIQ